MGALQAWSFGSGLIGANCTETEPGACDLLTLSQVTCG